MKAAIVLVVVGALAASINGAFAQGFDLAAPQGKGAGSEIQIYADEGLEWLSDALRVIAHVNAKAVRGDMTVTADQLTAYYRNGATTEGQAKTVPPGAAKTAAPGGGSQIWRLDADGNVTLSTPSDIATGIKAVYDMDKAVMVLTGHPAQLTTPNEHYSADDSLEYWETERMAVLRGNAVATGKDKKIQADVMTAHFKDRQTQKAASSKPSASGGLELSYADAFGHVIVTTPQDVVTGDRGTYNAVTGIVTITGKVKLVRNGNELNGGYAHMDLNSGISTLYGNQAGDPQGKARADGTFTPAQKGTSAQKGDGAKPASGDGEQRAPLFKGKVTEKPAAPSTEAPKAENEQ